MSRLTDKLRDPAVTLGLWLAVLICCIAWTQTGCTDHSQEKAQADTELRAQRVEDQIAQSRAADYEQCKLDHGENVGVDYRPDGSHRCTLKNGRPIRNQITVAHST